MFLRPVLASRNMGGACSSITGDAGGEGGNAGPLRLASALETHLGAFWKRENQDDYYVCERNFGGRHGHALFCVFDGHGTHGKTIAGIARNKLPTALLNAIEEQLKQAKKAAESESAPANADAASAGAATDAAAGGESSAKDGEPPSSAATSASVDGVNFKLAITTAFLSVQETIRGAAFDTSCSGTTASLVLFVGSDMYTANVGDSRVVLGQVSGPKGRKQKAIALTRDHRLSEEDEEQRCKDAGARVQPKKVHGSFTGEKRLWLMDHDVPGLVVTRALGDTLAHTIGCTALPEVFLRRMDPKRDQYVVLGSDGIWDMISNEEVVAMCAKAASPESAVASIRDEALNRWDARALSDNITVLLVQVLGFEADEDSGGAAVNANT